MVKVGAGAQANLTIKFPKAKSRAHTMPQTHRHESCARSSFFLGSLGALVWPAFAFASPIDNSPPWFLLFAVLVHRSLSLSFCTLLGPIFTHFTHSWLSRFVAFNVKGGVLAVSIKVCVFFSLTHLPSPQTTSTYARVFTLHRGFTVSLVFPSRLLHPFWSVVSF